MERLAAAVLCDQPARLIGLIGLVAVERVLTRLADTIDSSAGS